MLQRALVSMAGSPGPEAAQQRVVPLEHRVDDVLTWCGEAHRLVMAVASATVLRRASAEEEHDGAVVLLSPEVVQLLAPRRGAVAVIGGQHQDALLQCACRRVQVGTTDGVGGQAQDVPEEGELRGRSASEPL
jgi:hypothetical protein